MITRADLGACPLSQRRVLNDYTVKAVASYRTPNDASRVEVVLALQSGMQRDGAQRPQLILYRRKSDRAHQRGEFVGVKEARHRGGKIFVRIPIPREQPADVWKNTPAVPAIEIAGQSCGRLGEFQNRYGASRL